MRRAVRLLALALLLPAPVASAAESPTPTRQQVAVNVAWASTLAPEDVPPVERRAVVCLVDAGVDVTPDLPPDSAEGPIVARRVASALRYAGDDADGQGGTTDEAQHGTRMASYLVARPGNDWGTVGLVPWVRVLSLRAMGKGERRFPAGGYESAVRECQRWKAEWPTMSVVSLALGCGCELTETERGRLDESVASATDSGLSVVAAAGNHGGGSLAVPADIPGVLPATAGTQSGALCDFATWRAGALTLPGCGVDSHEGGTPTLAAGAGSSASAVLLASVLGALRSLAPSASREEVEDAVTASARSVDGHAVVDARDAAIRLGLGDVVTRAERRHPAPPAPQPTAAAPLPGETGPTLAVRRLPAPRLRWRPLRGSRIELRVLNRPRGADVDVRAAGRSWEFRARRTVLRLPRWRLLTARFISDDGVSTRTRVRNRGARRVSAKAR